MMNQRLTLIRTASNAVEHAMRIVGFGHNSLNDNLRRTRIWLDAAKRHTLAGHKELADMTLGNATTHLKLVLAQIEEAVS